MNEARLEQIVQAVLYEGYLLYPYRPSAKNHPRQRFTFGRVYPEAYSVAQKGAEPFVMQTECLIVPLDAPQVGDGKSPLSVEASVGDDRCPPHPGPLPQEREQTLLLEHPLPGRNDAVAELHSDETARQIRQERGIDATPTRAPFSTSASCLGATADCTLLRHECRAPIPGKERAHCTLAVTVRFLHPMAREVGRLCRPIAIRTNGDLSEFEIVPELQVAGQRYQTWLEAVERRVSVPLLELGFEEKGRLEFLFNFAASRENEPIRNKEGQIAAVLIRRQDALKGAIEVVWETVAKGLRKASVRILNLTPVDESEDSAGVECSNRPVSEVRDASDLSHGPQAGSAAIQQVGKPALLASETILMRTFASTHTVLTVEGGEFISLLEPAAEHREAANSCRNVGTWPVLVGDEEKRERDTMLSSPIILYDYPKVAAESAGPLFDGTEIDEILSLRILTLTEQEKIDARAVDEQARRLLERTESLSEETMMKMHGVMRRTGKEPSERIQKQIEDENEDEMRGGDSSAEPAGRRQRNEKETDEDEEEMQVGGLGSAVEFDDFFGAKQALKGIWHEGVYYQPGGRVRLRPKARADAIDIALAGQVAVIEAVEQDLEGKIYLAVVLENDPGKDMGMMRQPGHRFFYGVDEVEPVNAEVEA